MTITGFDLHLYSLGWFWVLDHRMEPVRRATGFVRPSSSAQPRGAAERRESQRHQGAPRHHQRFSYETPWPLGIKTGWEAKLDGALNGTILYQSSIGTCPLPVFIGGYHRKSNDL